MSGGIDPGCIRIGLEIVAGSVAGVRVESTRPMLAEALRGRPADAAVGLVPLLFALCGTAQGCAAQLALAAARGEARAAHLDPAIEVEALREHLWRWLLDLPPLLGRAPDKDAFVAAHGWLARGERDALRDFLDGPAISTLLRCLDGIDDVAAAAPVLLPALDAQSSWPRLARFDEGFCRAPLYAGQVVETGALARRGGEAGYGALARRWRARLGELRDWSAGVAKVGACGTASAVPIAPGVGRSLVETARGLLMHEIALDGDALATYFIVAPTEWNFHPRGPLAGWLYGRDATDRNALVSFAAHAVTALDPCVRWELVGL